MEVKIDSTLFREAISKTISVIDKKSTRPILSNCLIEYKENNLEVSATDLDISLKIKIPVSHNQAGKFCINSKNISDILRELPDSQISFAVEEDNLLKLSSGKTNYSLLIVETEDFPELNFSLNDTQNNNIKISGNDLLEYISRTSFAMSNDETRLFLNGIFFQSANNKFRAVAIDGHRLAMLDKEQSFENNKNIEKGIIVPRKGVYELKKIAEQAKEEIINLDFDGSFLTASLGENYQLMIRLVAREYPNYKAVIPSKTLFKAKVDKQKLQDSTKRIKILSNETTKGIKLILDDSKVTLMASNDNLGTAKDVLDIDYNGDKIEVSLNARYILEALSGIESDQVTLELSNSLSPVVFKDENLNDYMAIIMPLRI